MAFNINKSSKFSLTVQPKNQDGKTQLTLDNVGFANKAVSSLVKNLFNDLLKKNNNLSSEATSALENRFVSKIFDDLYKRGINPLRPEVLLVNEYVPIATGESDDNSETASINLNYGEGSNLKVNQVMRLIDLQRIIRKNILKISGDFLEEHIGLSNSGQKRIIEFMHNLLKDNISEFLKMGSDSDMMVKHLVELSLKPNASKNLNMGNISNQTKSNLVRQNKKNAAKSKNRKLVKKLDKKLVALEARGFDIGRSFVPSLPTNIIKRINDSDKSGYLESIARYVIFDYVMQNSIAFITRIYDLKDLLKESISIASTSLPPAVEQSSNTGPSTTIGGKSFSIGLANPSSNLKNLASNSLLESLGVTPAESNKRILSAQRVLSRWGMQSSEGPDGFSGNQRHDLSRVINANVSDNNEEVFGSNRHMYANLFANMLRTVTFMQTLDAEQPKFINKNKVAFTAGSKNLAKGIRELKSITPKSMQTDYSILDRSGAKLNGSKISSILNAVSDDKDVALTELMSAMCFDQISNVNIAAGSNKLLAGEYFSDFGSFDSIDNLLIQYFNKAFFDTGVKKWNDLASDNLTSFDYPGIANNDDRLGTYLKSRFKPRDDNGTLFVPNEHTYEDNVHREDAFLIASDYFFNKALSSENLKFNELKEEADRISKDIDVIVHDITTILGLDFDSNGNHEENLNGYTKDSNPLKYFYNICEILGEEAKNTYNNLDSNCDLAVPLIHAGKLDDLSFTANVIKGSFFSNISNNSNQGMLVNFLKDQNDNYVEDNLNNNKSEKKILEESLKIANAEADYLIEEHVWYKLFSKTLKNLVKDKDPGKYIKTDRNKYGVNKDKKYTGILASNSNGISKWNDTKEKDDNGDKYYTWEGYTFGRGKRKDDTHPKYFEESFKKQGSDDWFEESLNFPDQIDSWLIATLITVAVVAAILAAPFILGALGASSVAGTIVTVLGLGSVWSGIATLIIGGVVTLIAASASITAAIIDRYPDKEGRPRGIGFSKYGYFEKLILHNAIIVPKSKRPENSEGAESEEMILDISRMMFGLAPYENFIFKPRRQPSSGEKNDYWLKFNESAGNYGGIFKTNTAARYTLFTLFFSRMYYNSLCVRYAATNSKFHVKYYPTPWKAMSDALLRKQKDPDYQTNGKYQDLKSVYDTSYNATKKMMDDVKRSILYRRAAILRNLRYLKQNVDEINEAVSRAESILAGRSSEISDGEKVSLQFLKRFGFLESGMSFLNDNTTGALFQNYNKNYLLDFRSDEDETDNPEGISVYPFFKKESYDIRELKLMAKVMSEKGRGLTSSKEDNLGRKNIIHIGIPMGMLSALQNEAYQKTGEIEYYYSNNIAIHISKKNDLNPALKYQSRTYVFDMSKYITHIKSAENYKDVTKPGSFELSNHIEKYSDTWGLEDIKNNTEIITCDRKRPYYGLGVDGIKMINKNEEGILLNENIYSEDVYESMLENHIYDYYSKLYTESTTGINISETLFPLNRSQIFDGNVDLNSVSDYNGLVDELTARYPASNVIPDVAQEYYRVLKTIRSSLYFSSEARYQSCIGAQCFQRIFSIPFSERDFLFKQSDYNLASSDIYQDDKMPLMVMNNAKTGLSQGVVKNSRGLAQNSKFIFQKSDELFNLSPAKLVLEFDKGLNPNKTDVGSFIIEVAILKSSKLS